MLKTTTPDMTSHVRAIWFPTTLVRSLRPANFALNHQINRDTFILQSVIGTGRHPLHFRVLCLFGTPLHVMRIELKQARPHFNARIDDIVAAIITTNADVPTIRLLVEEPEIAFFARQVSFALPNEPLQGIDILRENKTGKLHAPESNPGGNTWHFSSRFGDLLRREAGDGRARLLAQHDALPLAARTLTAATRAYAT